MSVIVIVSIICHYGFKGPPQSISWTNIEAVFDVELQRYKVNQCDSYGGLNPSTHVTKSASEKPPFQRNPRNFVEVLVLWTTLHGGGGAPSTSSFRKCVEAILNLGFLGALGTMIVHTLLVPLQGLAFLCHNISMKCWVSNGDQVGILGENKTVESGKKAMSCLQMQWRNPLEIVDMFFVVHGSGSTIYSLQVHNAWDDVILRTCF